MMWQFFPRIVTPAPLSEIAYTLFFLGISITSMDTVWVSPNHTIGWYRRYQGDVVGVKVVVLLVHLFHICITISWFFLQILPVVGTYPHTVSKGSSCHVWFALIEVYWLGIAAGLAP